MLSEGGQEPPAPQGYKPGDRITAGIIGAALFFVGALMIDIASNGRLSRRLGGSPADEAERITREAVA
jgi:hypothetical protein